MSLTMLLGDFTCTSFSVQNPLSSVFKVLTPPCLVFAYLVDATIIQRLEFLLHEDFDSKLSRYIQRELRSFSWGADCVGSPRSLNAPSLHPKGWGYSHSHSIKFPTGCWQRKRNPSSCLFLSADHKRASAGVRFFLSFRAACSISGVVPRIL